MEFQNESRQEGSNTALKDYDTLWKFLGQFPIPPTISFILMIVIIATVLVASLCCCCRYYFKAKEKKSKRTEKIDLRKIHLFGSSYEERTLPGTDETDYNMSKTLFPKDKMIEIGKLKYSVKFNGEENILYVTILEGQDLLGKDISGLSDPYVRVSLIPASKKQYKTKVIPKNLNPVYNQTFRFKRITYQALISSTLYLKVHDSDRFSSDELLGEAIIPISELDLMKNKRNFATLRPKFKEEKKTDHLPNLGHICLGLGYDPLSNKLVVYILGCKGLPSLDEGGFSDPYVKFWLVQDGRKIKRRTSIVKLRTLNPSFDDRFIFDIDFDKIALTSLMFVVADYDKGEKGEPMGQLIVGQLGTGKQAKHWIKMRKLPGKPVIKWHKLRPPTISE